MLSRPCLRLSCHESMQHPHQPYNRPPPSQSMLGLKALSPKFQAFQLQSRPPTRFCHSRRMTSDSLGPFRSWTCYCRFRIDYVTMSSSWVGNFPRCPHLSSFHSHTRFSSVWRAHVTATHYDLRLFGLQIRSSAQHPLGTGEACYTAWHRGSAV